MCHMLYCWKKMWGLWEEGLDYTAETLGGSWVAGRGARDFKILVEVPCLQPLVATKRQNDFVIFSLP